MEKWEKGCQLCFNFLNGIKDDWHNYDYHEVIIQSDQFYSYVFKCGENFSGLTSKEALHLPTKKRTRDHWLPARIFVRAMMQYQIQILNDYELFKYYFREVCQSTIEITEYQNGIVKFANDKREGMRIKYLSINKYEICEDKEACNGKGRTGIIFFNTAKGSYSENKYEFINGFPLKKLIPEWITEFEKQFLIEKK